MMSAMTSLEHKIPPPVVGALVAGAMWWMSSSGTLPAVPTGFRYAAVALLVIAGLTIDVLGLLAFRASRTTINPLKPERASALVTGGVYRLTRNPMYVGMEHCGPSIGDLAGDGGGHPTTFGQRLEALHFFDIGLAPWPFVGPVIFILYITRFQIRPEERVLQRIFGDEFARYVARVRRWL